MQVAEEAVTDLPALELKGKAWQEVPTSLNQAAKLGVSSRLGPLAEQPRAVQTQVRTTSAAWVEDSARRSTGSWTSSARPWSRSTGSVPARVQDHAFKTKFHRGSNRSASCFPTRRPCHGSVWR